MLRTPVRLTAGVRQTIVKTSERFWFGHLDDRHGGSVVIWDQCAPRLPNDLVYLYHFKRDSILPFKKDIVRKKLRPISKGEEAVIDAALRSYFAARSRFSANLKSRGQKREGDYDDDDEYVEINKDAKTCYECNGCGFEGGKFGALLCPVCLGSGKVFY